MSDDKILDFNSIKKQKYDNRPITIKHSLLSTPRQDQYSLMIVVSRDRMMGRIGLQKDPVFSLELETPMTGEREIDMATEMERNLITDFANAVIERDQ